MDTLTVFAPIVNPAFEAIPAGPDDRIRRVIHGGSPPVGDEYRPTAGPDFIPSPEDEAEYLDLLADLEAREDVLAESAAADRLEAMEAAFGDPWDLISDGELVECGGFHPSAGPWD